MRRLLRTTRRLVVGLVSLALVGFAALVAIPTLLGFQTYVITTGSMAGTADPGSLVLAETVAVEDLAVGDVITYVPPADTGIGHPVTHRLTSIERQEDGTRLMVTKGDANAADDPWDFVLDGAVQPRMAAAVPYAGFPLLWLADRTARTFAIGLPAAIIALGALVDAVRAWRDPVEAEEEDPTDTSADGGGDGDDHELLADASAGPGRR